MTVGPVEFPAHQRARPASRPSPGRGIRQTKRSWRVRTSTPLVTFKRHATAPARKRASVLPGPLRAGAALCCLVRSVRAPRSGPFLASLRKGPPRGVLLRGRVLRRPRCGPTPFASLRGRASARTPPHPARLRAAARHELE